MPPLNARQQELLTGLCRRLVDQQSARVIVEPQQRASGFWFGGGNLVEDADGIFWLVGRYRNAGDSRTGVAAGERGLELAIFRSADRGRTWTKHLSWNKSDLDVGSRTVLSIEGAALFLGDHGVELFVSTENDHIGYPPGFESYLKPGTGVWTIERLAATTVDGLKSAEIATVVETDDPAYLHIKDPFVQPLGSGDLRLLFCHHPFCWTSSNTGYVTRGKGGGFDSAPEFHCVPRGTTWDVAMTRGTSIWKVPEVGALAGTDARILFYDGGECVRNLDEHAAAVKRPRGYSCEELGGAACFTGEDFGGLTRLSKYEPLFVSPHGTGCSRYVDVHSSHDGVYVTWQQSQPDGAQPLVLNVVSHDEIASLLAG